MSPTRRQEDNPELDYTVDRVSEKRFTAKDVESIVSANALIVRMERLDSKYTSVLEKLDHHMEGEEGALRGVQAEVKELKDKLSSNRDDLHKCAAKLEDRIKENYVTHSQLELSLLKVTDTISKKVEESNREIMSVVSHNKDDIRQFRNYISAVIAMGSVIIFGITLYNNWTTATKTATADNVQQETLSYLQQMRKSQDKLLESHVTLENKIKALEEK